MVWGLFNFSMCSSQVDSYYTLFPFEKNKTLAQNIGVDMWLRGTEILKESALLPLHHMQLSSEGREWE